VKAVLKENDKRNSELLNYYNPNTGEGSLVPRIPFWLKRSHKKPIMVPESMQDVLDFSKPLEEQEGDYDKNFAKFEDLRFDHDFEYWAFILIKIKDKESGLQVPFKLRLPQRMTLMELERMRIAGMPIRMIIVKARQWGGSTLVQFYAMWLQTRHKIGWNSTIVGQVEKQAKGVRAMYENAIGKWNQVAQSLSWKPFQSEPSWKQIPERSCTISIASMESPDRPPNGGWTMEKDGGQGAKGYCPINSRNDSYKGILNVCPGVHCQGGRKLLPPDLDASGQWGVEPISDVRSLVHH
jgi:hypothetical protein